MNALKFKKQANIIPWYERITESMFQRFVVTELESTLNITEDKALEKYKEMCNVYIFDDECKFQENAYSVRYNIVNKLNKGN
jgi:competence CoiA-like predicted nuclease